MAPLTRRACLAGLGALAAAPLAAEPIFLDGMGIAIKGYDPVAYFEIQEAVRGSFEHELRTDDATWWFSRAEYREMFERDPERYMPQFGGYDAEAMARGFKRRSDPTLWVMVDNRLYLHYSITDQNRWAEDIRGNIRAAEENWKSLKSL